MSNPKDGRLTEVYGDVVTSSSKEVAAHVTASGELVTKEESWPNLQIGELVTVRYCTFKVAHIGEKHLLLEPVGPAVDDKSSENG